MNVPPIMMSGLDLIIVQNRINQQGKQVRRIVEISEIAGMEGDRPRLNPIWKYDPVKDLTLETGVPSKLRELICNAAGLKPADFEAHVRQREKILKDLDARGIRDIESVTKVIQSFYSKGDA
jgi:flagellar protein FlaI